MKPQKESEKVLIFGGTGNIGSKVVKKLIKNDVDVTLLSRNVEKVNKMFEKYIEKINVIESDYENLEKIKEDINNNEYRRLFLLITIEMSENNKHIIELAKTFYNLGIEQIVFISTMGIDMPYRTYHVGHNFKNIEKGISEYAENNSKFFVTLRPAQFFSNQLWECDLIKNKSIISTPGDEYIRSTWIDTEDIAEFAKNILTDDIKKHGCYSYELSSEVLTNKERSDIFSKVLGREIKYVKCSIKEVYDMLIQNGNDHINAYSLAELMSKNIDGITPGIELILNKKPKKLETWIYENREYFN